VHCLNTAPLYDVLSTLYYGDDHLALRVDDVHRTNRVTALRIANEAVRRGISSNRAAKIIDDLLARAPGAIEAARDETAGTQATAAFNAASRSVTRTCRAMGDAPTI
jgi:hypothetical protein